MMNRMEETKKEATRDPVDEVFDAIREGKEPADYDHPPELTEEEKARRAVQTATRLDIIRRANEYIHTPVEERAGKKYLLAEIQAIVDALDDAFVLVVPQKDGVPFSITFNPHTPEPDDPTIPPLDEHTPASA